MSLTIICALGVISVTIISYFHYNNENIKEIINKKNIQLKIERQYEYTYEYEY